MTTRLRWTRVVVAAASVSVTFTAALGGAGVIGTTDAVAAERPAMTLEAAPAPAESESAAAEPDLRPSVEPSVEPGAEPSPRTAVAPEALPPRSGTGRRVVFSESDQRVWLVAASGAVRRTYLVSGSVYDNLDPGTYEVYSRSEQAWGIDDSGTMRYFVRFTRGANAAIGFHDIPLAGGRRVQDVSELGSPTSHGCIRQRRVDARALWAFAPLGTSVVVLG